MVFFVLPETALGRYLELIRAKMSNFKQKNIDRAGKLRQISTLYIEIRRDSGGF